MGGTRRGDCKGWHGALIGPPGRRPVPTTGDCEWPADADHGGRGDRRVSTSSTQFRGVTFRPPGHTCGLAPGRDQAFEVGSRPEPRTARKGTTTTGEGAPRAVEKRGDERQQMRAAAVSSSVPAGRPGGAHPKLTPRSNVCDSAEVERRGRTFGPGWPEAGCSGATVREAKGVCSSTAVDARPLIRAGGRGRGPARRARERA